MRLMAGELRSGGVDVRLGGGAPSDNSMNLRFGAFAFAVTFAFGAFAMTFSFAMTFAFGAFAFAVTLAMTFGLARAGSIADLGVAFGIALSLLAVSNADSFGIAFDLGAFALTVDRESDVELVLGPESHCNHIISTYSAVRTCT